MRCIGRTTHCGNKRAADSGPPCPGHTGAMCGGPFDGRFGSMGLPSRASYTFLNPIDLVWVLAATHQRRGIGIHSNPIDSMGLRHTRQLSNLFLPYIYSSYITY